MNLKEKFKVVAFFIASFFISFQAFSQCGSFSVAVVQDDMCFSNGIIEITPDPIMGPPFTYDIVYPNGNINTGTFSTNSIQIDSLASGTYDVTLSSGPDNCNASVSISQYAFSPNFFSPTQNGYHISCNGLCDGELSTAPQPFPFETYEIKLFQDSANGALIQTDELLLNTFPPSSFSYDSLCAGSYVVQFTSQSGCVREFSRILYEPDSLEVNGIVSDVLCSSDSTGAIDLTVDGGVGVGINIFGDSINFLPYTYDWTGPSSFSDTNEDIFGVGGGDYNMSVTDANNCTVSKSFTINDSVPVLSLVVDTFQNISCNGVTDGKISVSGTGGTAPYTYEWISGVSGNDSTITNLGPDTYEVVLTDANGCTDTLDFDITDPTPLSHNDSITHVACFGGNTGSFAIEILGGTPPYAPITYSPNVGITDSTTANGLYVSSLVSGTYTFTATDANSCVYTDSVTINQNSEIILSFPDTIYETCNGSNGSATVQVSGGIPGYTYNWSNGDTTPVLDSVQGGIYYTIEVIDSLNCFKSDLVFVPVVESVLITSVGVTDNTCSGDTLGSLSIETTGGLFPHLFSYTYLGNTTTLSSNDTTTVINNLASGSYSLEVEDSSGCVNTWSLPINVSENSTLDFSIDSLSSSGILACSGDNNGELFLDISGGNPFPGNYYWLFVNDPNFSQNLTVDSIVGLSAGTYNLTVQDADGCTAQLSYEILEPTPLSTSHVITNTSCFNETDGEALVIISGGTPNYSLSSNTFSNFTSLSTDTFRITGLSEGTYFYDVLDTNACELLNNTFYVGEPSQLEIIDVTSSLESCLLFDATASVSVSGGVGGYSYLWSYDDSFSQPLELQDGTLNPTVNASTVQNVTQGLIYIHVWDANSCYTLDSIVISRSNSPQLDLLGTIDNVCDGDTEGQISFNATGGTPFYEYSIDGGVNWQFLATFDHLADGVYSAIVRDFLGCTDVISNISINSPPPITVSVSTQTVSCHGSIDGSASVVSVNGGVSSMGVYSYSWQNSQGVNLWPANLSGINPTVTNLTPGSYQLEVKDDNGCSTIYSPVNIGEPLPVTVDLSVISDYNGVDISCFGYSDAMIQANASGGTGQYTFEWYNSVGLNLTDTTNQPPPSSASFDTLSFLPQDTYSVIVVDDNNCLDSNSIAVTHPSQIDVNFENIVNIRCEGNNDGQATAIYSGGLGFGNYTVSWTDSNNNVISLIAQATQLAVGDYVATYTDNNGCSGHDTVTINYSELFQTTNSLDTTSVSCFGSIDGSFNFNVTGGWQPYTYVWNDPLGQQSEKAIGLAPGQWYTNIITDANNCILIDSVYVTSPVDELEVSTFSIEDNDCFENSNGSITIEVVGGSFPYDFTWTGPNSFSGSNQNIAGLAVGTYNVVVIDNNGCEKTESYDVDGPNAPLQINSVITEGVSCHGLQDGSANLIGQIVGGTSPYNQDWQGENPNVLSAGNYSVEVTDNAGCKESVSFIIYEPSPLSMTVDEIDEYCAGQDAQILVHAIGGTPFNSGFYQYDIGQASLISPFHNYQSSNENEANIVLDFPENNNEADTLFLLTVTDQNGCEVSQIVEVHPARLFYNNESLAICSEDTIVISGDRFAQYDSYSWSISTNQPFVDNGSDIELVVNNSMTIYLTAFDISSACFFTDELEIIELKPSVELDEDIGILMGESVSISVTNGEAPFLWSTAETTNSIEVSPLLTTIYTAYALDTVTQCIGYDSVRVFVGMNEGFSPNADGYNDTWKIDYLNQYESLQIEIFNRWGNSLWKSTSPNIVNWDGKHNGKELPVGTYYYIITFDDSMSNEPLTGPVTIVR